MPHRVCTIRGYLPDGFEKLPDVKLVSSDPLMGMRTFYIQGQTLQVFTSSGRTYTERTVEKFNDITVPASIPRLARHRLRLIESFCDDPTPPQRGVYRLHNDNARHAVGRVRQFWERSRPNDPPQGDDSDLPRLFTEIDVFGSYDEALELFSDIRAHAEPAYAADDTPEPVKSYSAPNDAWARCYLPSNFDEDPDVEFDRVESGQEYYLIEGLEFPVSEDDEGFYIAQAFKLQEDFSLPCGVPVCARKRKVVLSEALDGDYTKCKQSTFTESRASGTVSHVKTDHGRYTNISVSGTLREATQLFRTIRGLMHTTQAASPHPASAHAESDTETAEEKYGMRPGYWT